MNYEPKEWAYGDTITAEELNRMEEGISSAQSGGGSAPLIVKTNIDTSGSRPLILLDHTWQEIADADIAYLVQGSMDEGSFIKTLVKQIEAVSKFNNYSVSFADELYTTTSANGYPELTVNSGDGNQISHI